MEFSIGNSQYIRISKLSLKKLLEKKENIPLAFSNGNMLLCLSYKSVFRDIELCCRQQFFCKILENFIVKKSLEITKSLSNVLILCLLILECIHIVIMKDEDTLSQ